MGTSDLGLSKIIQYFAGLAAKDERINSFGYGPIYDVSSGPYYDLTPAQQNSSLYKLNVDLRPVYPLMWVEPIDSNLRKDSLELKHKIHFVDLVEKDNSNRLEVMSDTLQSAMEVKAFIFKDFFYDIFPSDESVLSPVFEKYDDELAGHILELDLQIDWHAGVCDIPGLYPSGATFNAGPGYYSVALNGYLPLGGGTMTGPFNTTSTILSGGTNLYNIFATVSESGNTIWSSSTGTNSIIANNGTGNLVSGSFSLAAGTSNQVSSNYSSIVGGKSNIVSGNFSFIGNGLKNSATTKYSVVLGGKNNISSGPYSSISGGKNNSSTNYYSFIGAGNNNISSGSQSAIIAGANNLASATNSFIGTGFENSATTDYSSVIGGFQNFASGNRSFIGNGHINRALGNYSSILNGLNNSATTSFATILGGQFNLATGSNSIIGAGAQNKVSGYNSIIGAGKSNLITSYAQYSSIVGGRENSATTNYTFIGGGYKNIVSAYYSFIGNGKNNLASGIQSSVVGGRINTASGIRSFVGGGSNNSAFTNSAVIVGGNFNSSKGTENFIGGGNSNYTFGTDSLVVGGGQNSATNNYSSVVGGTNNKASGAYSIIGGGANNIASGTYASILGGVFNKSTSSYSIIGGGSGNSALTNAVITIAGGSNNYANAGFSTIGGGTENKITGVYSSILGGRTNKITGTNSIILGSFITGSSNNTTYIENARLAETTGTKIYSAATPLEQIFASISASTSISGTTNFVPVFTSTYTLGNSILSQTTATGLTVNGSVSIYGDVLITGTASTFNTQTVQTKDNNIAMNLSGSHVSALYGGITVLSGTPSGVASTWNIDSNGAWSANTQIFTSAITVNGGAIISGSTDLYNIFQVAGIPNTQVQPGTNTYTGGTSALPTVNVSALTINTLTASGASNFNSLSATTLSGATIFSGSTDVSLLFATPANITLINSQLATKANLSGATFTGGITAPSLSATTISGGTYYSGTTELSTLFISSATKLQNGLNTYTGGTNNLPTVNVSALTINTLTVSGASNFVSLSATTLSGNSIFSGSTPLSNIIQSFVTGVTSGITGSQIQNGTNTYTGGTNTLPTVNVSALTINTLTTSGATTHNSTLNVTGATTLASLTTSGATQINSTLTVTGNTSLQALTATTIQSQEIVGSRLFVYYNFI